MARIAVVGGGPAGLWAAGRALAAGHEVVVHERDAASGGLARSFDVAGVRFGPATHVVED